MSDNWFDMRGKNVLERCPPYHDPDEWSEYIRKYRDTEDLNDAGHPLQIDIELNGGCNMACPFCTHGQVAKPVPNVYLPVATYERIIDEAYALGVRSVKLNYINEPLMRRDLEEMIEYAHRAGMLNIYFTTNGLLLTKGRRARLLRTPLTKLFCSIDAVTAETYDQQRTDGRFDAIRWNILEFIRERNAMGQRFPQVVVSFLRNQINSHEAEQFAKDWKNIADVVNFQTMNEVPDIKTGLTIKQPEPEQGCKFPFKQLVIDHQGNVQPCCKLAGAQLRVGKVDTITLREAWDSLHPLRQIHRTGRWRQHPVCAKCMRCE